MFLFVTAFEAAFRGPRLSVFFGTVRLNIFLYVCEQKDRECVTVCTAESRVDARFEDIAVFLSQKSHATWMRDVPRVRAAQLRRHESLGRAEAEGGLV